MLTTDTKHHVYFSNRIARHSAVHVFLEQRRLNYRKLYWRHVRKRRSLRALVDNPYLRPHYPRFERAQDEFEKRFFSDDVSSSFEGHASLEDVKDVNQPGCLDRIIAIRPHVIVSFGTGLIGPGILGIDAIKVNVHRGILPKYRGLDSDLWAFYFQDFGNVGTTIHHLSERFDTGAMVEQQKLKIEKEMEVHQIRYYTTLQATGMVSAILDKVASGKPIARMEQDLSESRYYSHIPPIQRFLAIQRFRRHVRQQ